MGAGTVFSTQHFSDKFTVPTRLPVAKHALDCVLTWQTAVPVRGSSWSGPPSETRPAIWHRRLLNMSIEAHVAELKDGVGRGKWK